MKLTFIVAGLLVSLASSAETPKLQSVVDDVRTRFDVPGVSAAVIYRGDTLYAGGSGYIDLQSERPATADSVYYIGSVSKVLTATLALHLVEREKLHLDARFENIGHASGNENPKITLRHLLTHSSGLDREGDFSYWFNANFPDTSQLSDYLQTTRLQFTPGEKVQYSNIGYAAIGLAIAESTGMSYHQALRQSVLAPLQMQATGSPGPAHSVARGYSPRDTLLPDTSSPFAGVGDAVGDRHLREYHNASAMTPAFGIYSTVTDLAKLAAFIIDDEEHAVLSKASRSLMKKRDKGGRSLGLGTEAVGRCKLLTHGGWFAAHRSQLLIDTTNSIAIVIIANGDNANPRQMARVLFAAALRETGHKC